MSTEIPNLPPAFGTRSTGQTTFFEYQQRKRVRQAKAIKMAEAVENAPPTHQVLQMSETSFIPAPFSGKSREDAQSWLTYVKRYMEYKNLDGPTKLAFFKMLLREGAQDWCEGLSQTDANSLERLTAAFEQRFITSDHLKWHRATELFEKTQGHSETVDDYVSRLRKIAKTIPLDENVTRYAVIRGLRPYLKTQVIQRNPANMEEVLKAARAAEVTEDASYLGSVDKLMEEVRQSRRQFEDGLRKITEKVEGMAVRSLSQERRGVSPKRVTFQEQRQKSLPHPIESRNGRRKVSIGVA